LIPGHHVTTYGVENAGSQSYSTVTVELKAEKATILAAERNFSQITLLLRSANDPDHEDISGVVGDSANIQDMIAKLQKKETGGTSGEETPSSETGREGSSPGLTP
jgi:Flp pilus assembly protein CpaB